VTNDGTSPVDVHNTVIYKDGKQGFGNINRLMANSQSLSKSYKNLDDWFQTSPYLKAICNPERTRMTVIEERKIDPLGLKNNDNEDLSVSVSSDSEG
jgi:hypothetical protein